MEEGEIINDMILTSNEKKIYLIKVDNRKIDYYIRVRSIEGNVRYSISDNLEGN